MQHHQHPIPADKDPENSIFFGHFIGTEVKETGRETFSTVVFRHADNQRPFPLVGNYPFVSRERWKSFWFWFCEGVSECSPKPFILLRLDPEIYRCNTPVKLFFNLLQANPDVAGW